MSKISHLRDYPITVEAKLITHKNDPETSFAAAEKMIKSGALSRQQNKVYTAIARYFLSYSFSTGFTARELSNWAGLDYHKIQRRLNELRAKGLISRIKLGEERIGATDIYKPIYKKRNGQCVWQVVR